LSVGGPCKVDPQPPAFAAALGLERILSRLAPAKICLRLIHLHSGLVIPPAGMAINGLTWFYWLQNPLDNIVPTIPYFDNSITNRAESNRPAPFRLSSEGPLASDQAERFRRDHSLKQAHVPQQLHVVVGRAPFPRFIAVSHALKSIHLHHEEFMNKRGSFEGFLAGGNRYL